jgi:hypothetical protein
LGPSRNGQSGIAAIRCEIVSAYGYQRCGKQGYCSVNEDTTLAGTALFTASIEPELIRVCNTFVDLQSLRHSADYNTAISFKRAEVVVAISRAQAAHQDWDLLKSSDNATVFLLQSAKLLPDR